MRTVQSGSSTSTNNGVESVCFSYYQPTCAALKECVATVVSSFGLEKSSLLLCWKKVSARSSLPERDMHMNLWNCNTSNLVLAGIFLRWTCSPQAWVFLSLCTGTHQRQSTVSRSWRTKPQSLTLPWHLWSVRLQIAALCRCPPRHPAASQTSPPPLPAPPFPLRRGLLPPRETKAALLRLHLNTSPSSHRTFDTTTTRIWGCSYASTAASFLLLPISTLSVALWTTMSSMLWPSQTTPTYMSMVRLQPQNCQVIKIVSFQRASK